MTRSKMSAAFSDFCFRRNVIEMRREGLSPSLSSDDAEDELRSVRNVETLVTLSASDSGAVESTSFMKSGGGGSSDSAFMPLAMTPPGMPLTPPGITPANDAANNLLSSSTTSCSSNKSRCSFSTKTSLWFLSSSSCLPFLSESSSALIVRTSCRSVSVSRMRSCRSSLDSSRREPGPELDKSPKSESCARPLLARKLSVDAVADFRSLDLLLALIPETVDASSSSAADSAFFFSSSIWRRNFRFDTLTSLSSAVSVATEVVSSMLSCSSLAMYFRFRWLFVESLSPPGPVVDFPDSERDDGDAVDGSRGEAENFRRGCSGRGGSEIDPWRGDSQS
ncbi:hypothetical protein DFJ73DRAFT_863561 [Zopfochytrium polystomum]|nr:hypothetical protein DFJ73DRAFT_863561 [Zopfochytrium polystomum]